MITATNRKDQYIEFHDQSLPGSSSVNTYEDISTHFSKQVSALYRSLEAIDMERTEHMLKGT